MMLSLERHLHDVCPNCCLPGTGKPSPWDAEVYVWAAREPKEVLWYDTDHYFNDQARRDRDEWLVKTLR